MSEIIDIRSVKRKPSRVPNYVCRHLEVEMDMETRLLQCVSCNSFLTAFDWLSDRIKAGDRLRYAEMELRSVQQEIFEKNHELSNLKATVRRWKKKCLDHKKTDSRDLEKEKE